MTISAARLTLGLALVLFAPPALAQTAAPSLTPDELAVLRVIVECRKDPTPGYCAPFRGLVDHMAQAQRPPPPAPAQLPVARATQALSPDEGAKAVRFAQGHGGGPEGQGVPDPGAAKVALAATTDTKTASLALSIDLTATTGGDPNTLAIIAQAPLAQGKDYTNVATQDGMTKSSSIGLEYTRLKVNMTSHALVINTPEYQASCTDLLKRFAEADPSAKIPPSLYQPHSCNARRVLDMIVADAGLPTATADPLVAAATSLAREADPTINSVWMFTGGAKVGYERHAFYDPLTLEPAKVDRTPFEVSGAATYVFHGGDMSTTLSYKFQRVYKDGGADEETKTLCRPVGSPFLPCVNGFIGHPLRDKQHLISADFRYITPKGLFNMPMGLNPTATYDAQSGEYGFQFPVYVFANKAKGLTGGVRYDWTSDKHESVFGIFVATSFCVLPGYKGCPTGEDSK